MTLLADVKLRGRGPVLVLAATLCCALVACSGGGARDDKKPDARATASATPTSTPASTPVAPSEKPNIVLLMTDDEALKDMVVMPQTRRLVGAAGATFTRAFSSYPLCCPARVTVLTGQQAHNHGVMGNEEPWGGYTLYKSEKDDLPVWLQAAGYRTSIIGKYINGYPLPGKETYVPPGWTNWEVPAVGPYHYFNFTINQNGRLHDVSQYQSDFVADRASRLIATESAKGRPFFLWANFLAPHVGTPVEPGDPRATDPKATDTPAVAAKYRGTMDGVRLPRTASLNERDMSDKAAFMRRLPMRSVPELQEFYQQRLESLRSVDDAVGRIVGALDRAGVLRNTYIFFVSDNGFQIGEHRWVHKILGYEESIRVPMLLRGPGVPAGSVVDQQVSLADLSATVVSLAGATPGPQLDGVPVTRMIGHPSYLAGRPMLLEAGGWPFKSKNRLYTGVRTADDLVMLRWYDGTRELYDLDQDPLELDGRASSSERARQPKLEKDLVHLDRCAGESCNDLTDP